MQFIAFIGSAGHGKYDQEEAFQLILALGRARTPMHCYIILYSENDIAEKCYLMFKLEVM